MSMRSSVVATVRAVGLERQARVVHGALRRALVSARLAPDEIGRIARSLKEAPARAQLGRDYRRMLGARIAFELLAGEPDPGAIAVVMCLWNRPERIEDILQMLDAQRSERPLRLVLWNNNTRDKEHYRNAISAFAPRGAVASVELHQSARNVGGIGRFIAARELVRTGYTGAFIMLDDDENVSASFVEDLLGIAAPRTIGSLWAWRNDGQYWNRRQLEHTGDIANHTGTGGCVCDSALVLSEEFFTRIPIRYLFMEDIWMSQCALRSNWHLVMVETPVTFVLADLDQGHAIYDDKERFFTWLSKPGRVPVLTESRP